MMNRAIFLDRDGTINQDRGYIHKPSEFIFEYRAIEAISLLNQAGFIVIVVSNQAGIAHGHFSEQAVDCLHQWVSGQLALHGARIDAFYYCPHHPNGQSRYRTKCDCRKPAPGMLLRAAADFSIDLAASWMVGDHRSDMEAGTAAGVTPVFVLTGHGKQELPHIATSTRQAENLYEAVTKHILVLA
ncbi:D-glycero-beta-D-manno-heptose 1,7-bisphosphate 7-phosphatase [Anaerosporomusa subterranea]|nr:D-glycero-beta-D-manno-heptose 1,7-bisphosphate 7-phosphatase [Anaerosporomusa subterranea]